MKVCERREGYSLIKFAGGRLSLTMNDMDMNRKLSDDIVIVLCFIVTGGF